MKINFLVQRLPLRLRLAFFISGLMVAICLLLTLFINVSSSVIQPGHLQTTSLIGFLFATVLGGIGAYWLAGVALLPVKTMSEAAHQISANKLELRLKNEGPHDELYELAEAFNAMLARLEKAFEQQSRFVADAAHELRTPLAILRTNLEVVTSDPNSDLADYHKMAATLDKSLSRLERLVQDLLILSTEERTSFLQEFDIVTLVETVVQELEPTARANQIRMHCQHPLETNLKVQGDELLLEQVFGNLIENSIRYNKANGEVRIKFYERENNVLIEVADTGVGIAALDLPKIFDRFYRVDLSRSRHKGGAGLGLAIVRHILEQYKGFVTVESEIGKGSKFTVHLPIIYNKSLKANN